jgi:predicted DNA-binding WGR domain protein
MSELNLQTKNTQALDIETKSQLAKVKKFITANNADSFALAVELVRTLGLYSETTWLSLLAKSRIAKLVKLADSRVTNLLVEIAVTGRLIGKLILDHNGVHWLNGLTSLSDSPGYFALAKKLAAESPRPLYLNGLTSLCNGAAQVLSQHKTSFLLNYKTGPLYLNGLTSLSDEAAQALSQHKGYLSLSTEAKRGVGRVRRRLTGARLFEFEGGGSSKFWDTELRGAELVTRFGSIGTTGKEKVKTFPDAAAAAKEQAKLIKEKAGKGYQEF